MGRRLRLSAFLKSKKARCIAAPQVVKIPLWGGLEGPQPSKMKSYRPALPGGRGVCAPAQTFLKPLAEKAGAAGLFRHAVGRRLRLSVFLSKKARCMAAPFMIPWPAAGPSAGAPSRSCHPSACRLRPAGRFGARRRPCAAAGYTGCRSGPG